MTKCPRTIPLLLLLFLAACGGGSQQPNSARPTVPNSPPPPPPPAPEPEPTGPADEFKTAEFNRSWGLDAINSADAYALGFTGEGVIIGVLDFNFDFESEEINFHPASRDIDPDILPIYEAQIGGPAPTDEHGHAVAVVAAGVKNDIGTHGVAFDAQILAVDFFSNVNERLVTQDGTLFHVSNPWTYMTDNGARVVNKSIGFDEGDIIENPPVVTEAYVLDFDAFVVAEGGLLVSSAGNNEPGQSDPSQSNLRTIELLRENNLLDQGPGALIIVGAVDRNNEMAFFSDRAGVAQDYFLVAPGFDIEVLWNGVLQPLHGTSFSAPHVTGAAAILFQRWPNLTAREVANILFESATDLGAPGVDAIFGHGLLNLEAAMAPLGTSTMAVQGMTAFPPVAETMMALGQAFGDAGHLGNSLSSVTMFDGFQRDFQLDASRLIVAPAGRATLADIVDSRRGWFSSAVELAGVGTLSVGVRFDRNEDDEFAPGRYINQRPDNAPDHTILELRGSRGNLSWSAGSGLSLRQAIGQNQTTLAQMARLTRARRSPLDSADNGFATLSYPLFGDLAISVGVGQGRVRGITGHGVNRMRANSDTTATAVRLETVSEQAAIAIETGALFESDSLLGSRMSGAFGPSGRSRTGWLTLEGHYSFTPSLFVAGKLTGAITDSVAIGPALINSFDRIASSSMSLGVGVIDVWRGGDSWLLSVHQPLRVERANATIERGEGLNFDTGRVRFVSQQISLTPSGREIGLESAYRISFGAWAVDANLAYRFDADHIRGRREAAFLLGVSRGF